MGFFKKLLCQVGIDRKARLIMMRLMNKKMSKGMLLTLGVVVCLFLTGCREKRDQSVEHFNRGLSYLSIKQYDMAISEFTKAVEINPTYAEAYGGRGHAYCRKGEYDRAISDYTTVIKIDTKVMNLKDAHSWRNRGRHLVQRGEACYAKHKYDLAIWDFGKAIEDYTKAIEIDPKNQGTYLERGNAYFRRSDAYWGKDEDDKAMEDAEKAKKDSEKADSMSR